MRPTGTAVVDHVLGGFPPPGLPLVVAGAGGCGRTVLCLQLAHGALARGESVVILSSEPAPSLIHQAEALGFGFDVATRAGTLVLLELDPAAAALLRAQGGAALAEALRAEAPEASLVILDPVTALTAEIVEEPKLREASRALVRALPVPALVLTVEHERLAQQRGLERVLGELCGAYVTLEREPSGRRVIAVGKSRAGVGAAERAEFAIGPGGTHLVDEALPLPVGDACARGPVAGADDVKPLAPLAAEDPDPPARRPVVLLVDDSRLQRELVGDWLAERYEVVPAADGFEAMALLLARKPDLVILDLIMPRISGYELLCALRRADLDVPVLVSSSRLETPGDRLGPLVLGATDFLPKPLTRLELEHKVDTLLHLRRERDRRFDASEAEALFGHVSPTRRLEPPAFRERLLRACAFGDRYGLPSSLVRVEARDARALDRWLAAADATLRFEDALLRDGDRAALVLLVATPPEEARRVLDRLGSDARGTPPRFEVQVASPALLDSDPGCPARSDAPESARADPG